MENKGRNLACKFEGGSISEKGLVHTRNKLDLMICADDYY